MPVTQNKRIAILGLGLLGASLGMSLAGKGYRRIGWNRTPVILEKALALDVVDESFEKIEDAVADADITVFCLPIPQIIEYALKYAGSFRKSSIVTDIGSVKVRIFEAIESRLADNGVEFLGSHPMAGTEKSGIDAAFGELYKGATVFLTPTERSSREAVESLTGLWKDSGAASVVPISAYTHDNLVAHTSHVPHVISMVLTQTVLGDEKTKIERYAGCAGGFRDTSRISSSSPEMWREIIENNREEVLEGIKSFERKLDAVKNMIEDEEYRSLQFEFAKSKKLRDEWILSRGFAGKNSK